MTETEVQRLDGRITFWVAFLWLLHLMQGCKLHQAKRELDSIRIAVEQYQVGLP